MSDAMSNAELLSPGNQAALGANHAENVGFGEARDLGPGEVEEMFGPAKTPRQRLEGQGFEFVESEMEKGGGGGAIDAIDDWVVNQRGGYDKLLQQIEQNKWADNAVWKLPDGMQISVAEVKRRAAAAVSPPAPEPQPTPRPGDWRDNLPQDQRQRLGDFERRISGFNDQELQLVEAGIREARAKALKDGWNHRSVQEGDADMCLRMIQEKLVGQNTLESMLIENGLYDHVKSVQQRKGLKDLQDTFLYLAGKLGHHDSLLENPPPDLFPPTVRLLNGRWDEAGDKLVQFLRKLTTGNKLNNGG